MWQYAAGAIRKNGFVRSGPGVGKAAIILDDRKKWNAGWEKADAIYKNKASAELRPAEAYPKRKECF